MQHFKKYLTLLALIFFIFSANAADAESSTKGKSGMVSSTQETSGIVSSTKGTSEAALSANKPYWRARSVESIADKPTLPVLKSSVKSENSSAPAISFEKVAKKNVHADHLNWIYDAWLSTDTDADNDCYHQSFELTFDADTSYVHADVFAVVYLGDSNTYKEIHTTSVFSIHSDAGNDEFTFKTDLLQGFPSDDYDVLIELYDADSLELQDSYDHTSDSDLSLISLESAEYEHRHYAPTVSTTEHGGSISVSVLLALSGLIIFRRRYFSQ